MCARVYMCDELVSAGCSHVYLQIRAVCSLCVHVQPVFLVVYYVRTQELRD